MALAKAKLDNARGEDRRAWVAGRINYLVGIGATFFETGPLPADRADEDPPSHHREDPRPHSLPAYYSHLVYTKFSLAGRSLHLGVVFHRPGGLRLVGMHDRRPRQPFDRKRVPPRPTTPCAAIATSSAAAPPTKPSGRRSSACGLRIDAAGFALYCPSPGRLNGLSISYS